MTGGYGLRPEGGRWRLYVGVLVVAFPLVVGLLAVLGVGGDDGDPGASATPGLVPTSTAPGPTSAPATSADASPSPSTAPSDPAPSSTAPSDPPDGASDDSMPRPTLVTWGGSGTQLAIVIRNDSPWLVRRAKVRISVWDSDGELVRRTTGPAGSTCCTVLGLPPGGEYGLFLLVQSGVEGIDRVRVRYATLATQRVRPDTPRIDVSDARLLRTADDTVVEATFTRQGEVRAPGGYVVGQAFLADPHGRLAGVISGRFYCFSSADPSGTVAMELLRPMPPGTSIERAFAYPIPPGVPVRFPHACDPPRGAAPK